ncbi:MAG: tetratricopeptide repeat protein [Lewinellaceae bacterium]|nr:tetratricopeptide repeat protein [Lewinellaceae bacterium]
MYLSWQKKPSMVVKKLPTIRQLPVVSGIVCICLFCSSCDKSGPSTEAPPLTYVELVANNPAARLNQQGDSATAAGDYPAAIRFFQQSMESAAASADSFLYYDSKLDMACVYDRLGELDKAIESGKQVLEAFIRSQDSSRIGRAYSTLSAFYGRNAMPEESINAARKGFELLKKSGSLIEQCAVYNQMAFNYSDAGRWADALPLLDTALILMQASGVLNQLSGIYLNLGDCHRNLGHKPEARRYLNAAIKEADSQGVLPVKARAIERLSQMAEAEGAYKEALRLFQEAASLKKDIFTEEKARSIQALETAFETKEKEQQLLILKAEKRTQAAYRNLALALMALSVAILAFWLYRWRDKAAYIRLKLTQNQEQLLEITQLLLTKNAQLKELETAKNIEMNLAVSGSRSPKGGTRPLSEGLFNMRILTEEDWMTFKKHFERSFPGYLSHLRETFPELSQAEERLFLLYKLNLNSKEITKILGISESTVKKGRTRLRKKLGLDKEQDLEQFIREFH